MKMPTMLRFSRQTWGKCFPRCRGIDWPPTAPIMQSGFHQLERRSEKIFLLRIVPQHVEIQAVWKQARVGFHPSPRGRIMKKGKRKIDLKLLLINNLRAWVGIGPSPQTKSLLEDLILVDDF